MRDDDGPPGAQGWRAGATASRLPWSLALAVVALGLPVAPPATAYTFHGSAELQYQNVDRSRILPTQDSWTKALQADFSQHLPGSIELSSNFRFVEQTIARQSDRVRVPEGRVRLAHRNFGLSAGYRPTETTDSHGLTIRQRDVTLMANAQKAGLPSVAGSWVRSRLDPSALAAGTATVTRSLSAQYGVPHATFRAGYGDRLREQAGSSGARLTENHVSLGSTSQFQIGRAPISVQYDFSQARAIPNAGRSQRSLAHLASTGTSFAITRRTSTGVSYNYRRTQIVGVPRSASQEHNGGLSVTHTFNPAVQLSGGAGVRSAVFSDRTQTERFLSATATAQGEARPGWRLSAAATHSVNWLPGAPARPADNVQSSTSLRLARGLDIRGDVSVSTARPLTSDSTALKRQVAVQSGAGVTAKPLRTVYLDANLSHSRAGASLFGAGASANSYSTGLRLTPYPTLQLNGRWGLTTASGLRGSTAQASLQWALAPSLQISAGYTHARQEIAIPPPGFVSRQEGFNGSLSMRLAQDLNASVQYNEANRGQPNRVRQLTANVVRSFGN